MTQGDGATAPTRVVVLKRRITNVDLGVVALVADTAAGFAGGVVADLAVVGKLDLAVFNIALDIDTAAVPHSVVVHDLGVVHSKLGAVAEKGNAAAFTPPTKIRIDDVARDSNAGEVERGAFHDGNTARAVLVVANAAGDQASVERVGIVVGTGLPKMVVVVKVASVLAGGLVCRRAAVDVDGNTLVDLDDLTVAFAVPLAVGPGLVAVDHVAVKVDGVGVARVLELEQAVVLGVPIVHEVDGDIGLVQRVVCRRGHVADAVHDVLDAVRVVRVAVVAVAGDLGHGARLVLVVGIRACGACGDAGKRKRQGKQCECHDLCALAAVCGGISHSGLPSLFVRLGGCAVCGFTDFAG